MSGHSKWATIKRDKESNDSKKGAAFTKLSRDISIAAKNGGDPSMNAPLAAAITKAKAANMPNDKIQKAINKGTGVNKLGIAVADVTYEAYGPGDVPIIIDAATDNKNRTFGEVKMLVEKNGGRYVEGGAVTWLFEVRGWVKLLFETPDEESKRVSAKWGNDANSKKLSRQDIEEFELNLMDQEGLLDIEISDDEVDVYTSPESLGKIRKYIEDQKIAIEEYDILKLSKNSVEVTPEVREKVESMVEKLEEHDDVQKVWSALG